MSAVSFTVAGIPAPQGSKTPWRSEANPNTRPWRAAIHYEAQQAMPGPPFPGPVYVWARFVFPRPKSHFRSGRYAHLLKNSAPWSVSGKPDLDKLLRALFDGMTGVVFRDDAQVAEVNSGKFYVNEINSEPGVAVRVSMIDIAAREVAA